MKKYLFFLSIIGLFSIGYLEKKVLNPPYAQYLLKQAENCLSLHCSLAKKEKLLNQALYYDPNISRAYYQLSVLAEDRGEGAKAVELLKRGAAINFKDALINERLGRYYLKTEQEILAFRHMSLAVRESSNCKYCHFYFAFILEQFGEREQALAHFMLIEGDQFAYPEIVIAHIIALIHELRSHTDNRAKQILRLRDLRVLHKGDMLADQLEKYITAGEYPPFMSQKAPF